LATEPSGNWRLYSLNAGRYASVVTAAMTADPLGYSRAYFGRIKTRSFGWNRCMPRVYWLPYRVRIQHPASVSVCSSSEENKRRQNENETRLRRLVWLGCQWMSW